MNFFFGCGRTRDAKGNVEGWHLNLYVNCIHTLVGHSRLNMEVLVAEFDMNEIKYVGQLSSSQNSRVIDTEGISYAVTNGEKGGEPNIIEKTMKEVLPLNPDDSGLCRPLKAQYYKNGCANFLKTDGGSFAATGVIERDTPMKGSYTEPRICTMVGRDPNNPKSRKKTDGYVQMLELGDDVSNTLASVQKDNLVAEPLRIPQATKQGYIEVSPGSTTRRGRVQEGGKVSPKLMASGEAPCHYEGKEGQSYRIRKLTPRECFRLMGVQETNIDKIQNSGVSQSQQYKMAGNSIVVDVLENIFRKMFVEIGQESQQLSLF